MISPNTAFLTLYGGEREFGDEFNKAEKFKTHPLGKGLNAITI